MSQCYGDGGCCDTIYETSKERSSVYDEEAEKAPIPVHRPKPRDTKPVVRKLERKAARRTARESRRRNRR